MKTCVDCEVKENVNSHMYTYRRNKLLEEIRDTAAKISTNEYEDVCCACSFERAKKYNDFLLEQILLIQEKLKTYQSN